jgi:hypothetical protein
VEAGRDLGSGAVGACFEINSGQPNQASMLQRMHSAARSGPALPPSSI